MPSQKTLWVLGIFLIATTMRTPMTAAGVLTATIRDSLLLTGAQAGLVTSIPLLVFCASSLVMPRLADRLGINRVLLLGMGALFLGQIIRYAGDAFVFLFATGIMALGISSANVLLPAFIKEVFPEKAGVLTSSYISLMILFAGISGGLTLPLMDVAGLGWRQALAVWSLFSLLAFILWFFLRHPAIYPSRLPSASRQGHTPLWRQALVWQVAAFMGLQSVLYFSLITWLPDILAHQGASAGDVSFLIFMFQTLSIPASFFAPILAEKVRDQRWIGLMSGGAYLLGAIFLLPPFQGIPPLLVILVLAIGSGSTIALAMLFFNLRTEDSATAGQISGLAQTVGYFTAALAPVAFGSLNATTQSWLPAIWILIFVSAVLTLAGYLAGRDRKVV